VLQSGDVTLATVSEIWCYPVKSMRGERVASARVDARGLRGDRLFAVCDAAGKLGSGKDTRRMRRMSGLLGFGATLGAEGDVPRVTTPEGSVHDVGDAALDARLSEAVGFAVSVQREAEVSHFDAAPVHLVTRASLDWLRTASPGSVIDPRRFRPNLVLDAPGVGLLEDAWIGQTIVVGATRLRVTRRTERCVMTAMPQGDLPDDPAVLRAVARESAACFGVYAEVEAPGCIALGDAVSVDR
jgi:hypothetical protein